LSPDSYVPLLENGIYFRPWLGVSPEARADRLLERHLSLEQLREWKESRSFCVIGNVKGVRYRIYSGVGGPNIAVNGRQAICVGPPYGLHLPDSDRVFVQKLYIELAEDKMLEAIHVPPERWKDWPRYFY